MEGKLKKNEPIYDFAKYFVGGVVTRTEMIESMMGAKIKPEEIEKGKNYRV